MFTAKRKGILALLISVMAAALLAFGVFFALPSTTASAAEGGTVATIEGGSDYTSLQLAIDGAEDGDTIVLVNDVAESVTVPAGLTLTLDLNGKNVTNTEGKHTISNKGTLTIIGEGVVDNTSNQKAALYNYGTMYVYGGSYTRSLETGANPSEGGANTYYNIKNLGHMTIGENAESKVSVTQSGKYSSLVVNGYHNVNEYNAQIGNVTTEDKVPTIVINGGYYSGGIITVKVDDRGVATINGGTFTNVTQNVVQNNNVLTINGGEFNGDGTAEQTILTRYYDGGINTGYTEITGGTIHGVIATNSSKADYSISGGSFDTMPDAEYFKEGFAAAWDEETGAYVATVGNFVAEIGNKQYTSLQEAVNAVPNNTEEPVTVTLIGEPDSTIAGGGVGLFAANGDSKNIIIDFNGLTYEIVKDLVGSSGTVSQSFHLEKGNTVTLTNGKITSNLSIMLIQNYCNLTLDGIILDGKETNTYVVSNNFGKTVITGNTEIIAAEGGQVAFDVYYGLSESYFEGVTVCIDENFTGSITGKVEYGSSDLVTDDTWIDNTVLEFAEGNTGTFNIELYVHRYYQPLANADKANINVAGGTFTSVLNPNYIAEGANLYTNGTNYKVGQSAAEGYDQVVAVVTDAEGQYVAGYATLQAAINAAGEDDTIVLVNNVTESVTVPAGKTITLDLNGYTLTNSTGTTITNLGTLTIEDSSNDKTGAVYGNSEYALFNEIGATATLNGGLFTNSGNASYVISNHGTMTINEGVTMIQASGNAVAGPSGIASGYYTPDDKSKTAYLTINGGKFSSPRITIKNDEISYLTINGGEFDVEGTNVQSVQNWTYTTITGGTFYGTVHMWTYDSVPVRGELNIEGGDFKNDIVAWDYDTNAYDENPNVNVYGGNFEVAVKPEYVAEDTYFYPTENGYTASAEEPAAEETTGVAMIGKYVYSSLQAAIDAAEDGDTIVLVNDVAESVNVPAGLTLTLDLNGKNVTNTEGQNTITNKGTLTIIGEGVVDNTSNQKAALYNYGTMYVYGGSYTRSLETGANPSEGGANTYYNIKNLGHMTIGENAESKVSVTQSGKYSSLVVNGYHNVNEYNAQIGNVTTEDKVPTIVINGGYYSGGIITVKVDDRGVATINGGTFTNVTQNVVQNNNVLTINGGEFNGDGTAEQTILTRYYDGGINTGYTEITGGTIHGVIATNSSKADYSISGGSFDVKPSEDYFAPGYDAPVLGADGYYTTISVAANIEAQADVKLYAAALGIKWSELTEENAAAVLEAYDAIYSAATAEEIAAAKVAAMAELEEYAENAAAALEEYKADMIAEVEAYAAGTTEGATVVAVPTYVVSAIYGATSTAEIDKYVAVAEAEIDELRAARDEAKAEAEKLDQAMADIDSIISALSIAQGEGGAWTSALLEEIKQLANSANTAAGEIKDLIGTPATEGGNNTLAGMIEEAQNEITTAINEAKAAIVEVLEGADGNGGLKAEIAEVKGVADSLAALFDGEGEGDLAAMLSNVNEVVTEVQGNVDKIEADLGVADGSTLAGMIEKLDSADSYLGKAIAGIQTALNAFIESATKEVGAISGKLDELSTAVSKLPTTDNSAAISELKELISAVDGKVDDANEAIDEVNGKVDTISDGVSGALASLNASIGSLAEAQNALKTAVEGYKAAVDNALISTDTKLEGLAESIEGLAGDNAELKVALELLQQTADDLRDAVDAVDDGNQTDLTAISAAVATLQQSVTELAGNVDAVAGTVNGVAQNNEDTLGGVVALYTFMAVIVVLLVVVLVIVSLKRKR